MKVKLTAFATELGSGCERERSKDDLEDLVGPEQWVTWSCQFCKGEDQEVNTWKRVLALNLLYFICSIPEGRGIGKMHISEYKSKYSGCLMFESTQSGLCGGPQLSVTGRSPVVHSVGLRAALWAGSRGTLTMGSFLPVGTFHTGPGALRAQEGSVSHTEHDSLSPLPLSSPPTLS